MNPVNLAIKIAMESHAAQALDKITEHESEVADLRNALRHHYNIIAAEYVHEMRTNGSRNTPKTNALMKKVEAIELMTELFNCRWTP